MTITTTQEKNRILLEQIRDALSSAGTNYWSCPGTNFTGWRHGDGATDDYHYAYNLVEADEDSCVLLAPVFLPHGAVITGVAVYGIGLGGLEEWVMVRTTLSGWEHDEMANASINTEDTSISYATVDNSAYSYTLFTTTLDDGDQIRGAKITYTL